MHLTTEIKQEIKKKLETGPLLQLVVSLIADPLLEIDHEIISTVTPLLPLIREGLLSVKVTSESMCTNYWLKLHSL